MTDQLELELWPNPEEQWRAVIGYEGYYQVSTMGRVRSLDRTYTSTHRGKQVVQQFRGRILKPDPNNRGYLQVGLSRDGKQQKRLIHRLVLEMFVGPCPAGMEGCHFDGNPANNRLDNLRWDTASANQRDKIRHGTYYNTARKTHCPQGHPYDDENTAVCKRKSGRTYRGCRTCRLKHTRQYQAKTTIEGPEHTCEHCGSQFRRRRYGNRVHRFCSRRCHYLYRTAKHRKEAA